MPLSHIAPSNEGGRLTVLHVVVIGLSFLLTLSAWQFSKYQVETRTELRFEAARDRALGLIVERMENYEDALWAGVAAVESHGGDISHGDWRVFARTLRIEERYPGINGIGVIHFHTDETLPDYLAKQRQERPEFRVFPTHSSPEYMPISYIEPEDINAAAVGLDVAHEANRRNAALKSRDTGSAQITGPIVLVQDADHTSGFLFYAPFYRGDAPADVTGRRDRFLGTVYAPFVVHKLMEGLLTKDLRSVRFSISDDQTVIHDEHNADDATIDPNPLFSEQIPIDLYGRTWTLDMRTNLRFREENTYAQPTVILTAGLLIEALIVTLLLVMSRANKRAMSYADQVTDALKKKTAKLADTNEKLSLKNDELEQFAYVTSHDLRTPIRGICGLTGMIQEDLEDYFSTSAANPDVSQNLDRIHERIERMDRLISGILEYSQVATIPFENEPIVLKELVEAMRLDFGLSADQLKLRGDVESVHVDSFGFRRVLENLVGNAIKYHDGLNALEITICTQVSANQYTVKVIDNGPGIDPQYHDRIFDVFQTLRTGDAPESTGIGLAIVKKAVLRHGGEISLLSTPNRGATFSFVWSANSENPNSDETIKAA